MTQTQVKKQTQPLKPDEALFVKKLVRENNENGAKTAKEVFGIESDGYARLKAHRLITKDNVSQAIEAERESLHSALIKQGITPIKIAQKIDTLLEATIGEDKPDTNAIDKGLKHATAIYGITHDKPSNETRATYNFIFAPEAQARIKAIDAELKSLLTQNVQENKET